MSSAQEAKNFVLSYVICSLTNTSWKSLVSCCWMYKQINYRDCQNLTSKTLWTILPFFLVWSASFRSYSLPDVLRPQQRQHYCILAAPTVQMTAFPTEFLRGHLISLLCTVCCINIYLATFKYLDQVSCKAFVERLRQYLSYYQGSNDKRFTLFFKLNLFLLFTTTVNDSESDQPIFIFTCRTSWSVLSKKLDFLIFCKAVVLHH